MSDQGMTFYGLAFNGAFSATASNRSEWYHLHNKDFPQPGKYTPNFYDKPSSSQWKFGSLKRQGPELKLAGAPIGTYDVGENIKNNDNPKYSMGEKLQLENKRISVGPTSYRPKEAENQIPPQFSFGYKQEFKWAKEGSPPPNIYQNNIDEIQFKKSMDSWKSRKTGFSTGKQRDFYPSTIELGPGQYNPDIKVLTSPISFSIPQGQRHPLKPFTSPGPGAYDPRLKHSKSQGFSMGNKYVPIKTSDGDTPGPGAYQAKKPQTVQNIRIGKDNRIDVVTKESLLKPGPGDYDQTLPADRVSHLETQSIGVSKRPEIAKIEQIPGPGRYQEQSTLGGSKWSMRIKVPHRKSDFVPGPGHYQPDDPQEKPINSYTIPYTPQPGLTRSQRILPIYSKYKNIGPGSYNVAGQFNGPKMSMSKASRFRDRDQEDVGPSSYSIPDTIGRIPKYLLDRNKDGRFLSLQLEEQKLRASTKQ